jgi:hypothetical protein
MTRIGLSTYRKIYWRSLLALFLSLPVTAVIVGADGSPAPLTIHFCLFLFWLIFGRRIALRLVPLVVRTLECPGCHEEIDTVGVWNCACGFNDHRETHLLAKRCPKCGKGCSHVDCPRCTSTILLW